MDFKDLQPKPATELQRQLTELREQLRQLRFKVAHGQHKDVREVREKKRDIARLQTRLRQLSTS